MAELDNDATTEPTDRRTLPADEALALLQAGKPLENVRVDRLVLRGEFALPVRAKNCTFVRPVFERGVFHDDVALVGCTIDRPSFRRTSEFRKNLDLSGSTLNKFTLARVTVRGDLSLANAVARGRLFVSDCKLDGRVSCWDLCVDGWFEFKGCAFAGDADLRAVQVEQGLILGKCTFARDVLLRGVNICKKTELTGSRFDGLLDLGKAKLLDFVYLEQIEQGPGQTFAFLNAVAERIQVRPEQLDGRLASERQGRYDDAMHEYGLLKRSYQNLHRYEQEDWAFYRFKVNQRRPAARWRHPWSKVRQFADWLFLDLGCGYGTNPYRAVRTAGVIILGFALAYGLGFDRLHVEKLPFPDLGRDAWPNRVLVSLLLSVSVFTSGIGGIRDLAQGWMNVPLVVESIMGTLLWGLFIVAFSRKVIR
jgi:hypothetical protein